MQELGGGGATQQPVQGQQEQGHAAPVTSPGRLSPCTRGARVCEWEAPLSGPMGLCQAALVEMLDGLIRELRRTHKIDWWEAWGGGG